MAALADAVPRPDPSAGAWAALLDVAGHGGDAPAREEQGCAAASPWLCRSRAGTWEVHPDAPAGCRDLLSLYLPLVAGGADAVWVVGHLGQSLNGCIATRDGEASNAGFAVTGPENILHLHRMRALCDAVLVGAGTVAHDDPRLTTRLVPGNSPVRVVLDPRRRLAGHYQVFRDGAAPTLLCAGEDRRGPAPGHAELLAVPWGRDGLRLDLLLAGLAARGLKRLFIEGGGVTVSRFLAAGCLSRLQLAIAPLLIGQGRPGLHLPCCDRLADALRVAPHIYRMGHDLLYDIDLSGGAPTLAHPRGWASGCAGIKQVL